ncbi:methyltransferase, FkbM family [Rubidibacter lacunae KORDI 51-2]|uniref:Methyltransferase, FkbM family n=1 Tax=Rubidibacter lacunae KORDI 51-2 TaxID=582515 RepID=U5DI30_9CHRO|nr:FkbM family methyltransferase [Rubidibacter lacunae]ERN40587.1 methyltransferase, FkbM family [Rubidibacter lacunae KORDI 51-2]
MGVFEIHPKLAFLVLPYARRELPGWGRLLKLFKVSGAEFDPLWHEAATRIVEGKWHGYGMSLDLANWSDRLIYFIGRYYDLPPQLVVRAVLAPGDKFVDVGAHKGMLTLIAAARVGTSGSVLAVEPNPGLFAELQQLVETNSLTQVRLHHCGLADTPAELTLNVLAETTKAGTVEHSNLGTFAELPDPDDSLSVNRYRVPVVCGDDLIPDDWDNVAAIKIDTEGFDSAVIRGLRKTIDRCRPVVITEVIAKHLENAGSSITELCEIMQDLGYIGHNIEVRSRAWQHQLYLHRASERMTREVVWLHPDGIASRRLQPFVK